MWFGGCKKKRTSHNHSTCAHTGRLDSSLLDKTAQENFKQKIDFGGSSMPSLFNTHAYQVVYKSDYIISLQGIISNQIVDLFLPLSSKTFSFFFLSCLVFCISCTIALTLPSHPISCKATWQSQTTLKSDQPVPGLVSQMVSSLMLYIFLKPIFTIFTNTKVKSLIMQL